MQIQFKLFASLADYLPAGAIKNVISLEVPANTTPNNLITKYALPQKEVHLVLLNGAFLQEADRDLPMKESDTLAIWPPVAGG